MFNRKFPQILNLWPFIPLNTDKHKTKTNKTYLKRLIKYFPFLIIIIILKLFRGVVVVRVAIRDTIFSRGNQLHYTNFVKTHKYLVENTSYFCTPTQISFFDYVNVPQIFD